jgi:uncharacterized protein DUF1444
MALRVFALKSLCLLSFSAMACELSQLQVQTEALAFLRKAYPGQSFAPGKTLDVVLMGKVEFGLQNLRSKLCLANPPPGAAARDEAMRTHFDAMMLLLSQREPKAPHGWPEARGIVTPQFMPTDYLRPFRDKRVLVTRPFLPGVELAVVLVQKDGYGYVREEDRVRWKIDEQTLFETALKNLDAKNTSAKLQGGGDPNRFLAVEEKDGYDAVRLLFPWVRQEAAKFLGEPFLAAIPNRDFLVMWSTKNTNDFQQFARARAQDGFSSQPYPLTPTVFRVWADGRTELVPQ